MWAPAHQEKVILSEQEFVLPEHQCDRAEGVGQAGTAKAVWGRAAAEHYPNTQLCTAYSAFSATLGTSVPLWEHEG